MRVENRIARIWIEVKGIFRAIPGGRTRSSFREQVEKNNSRVRGR
jgi:hypothetical protein